MDKHLLLTSAVVMSFVCPAMAASPTYVYQFPNSDNNEYMQPNTVYVDAAIATNMAGVYQGDVWAKAIYVPDTTRINCAAGTYLPANTTSCATCLENNFCEGGEFSVDDSVQGLQSCNVAFADAGSEACEIAHATSASRSYSRTCYHKTSSAGSTSSSACTGTSDCGIPTYGECYVTACAEGYHKNQETNATACPANTYTVRYNANGGSGTMSNSNHTYDGAEPLRANTFTNGTKKFLGWATSAGSSTVAYADQAVSNLTSANGVTVDLYAVWGNCEVCAAGTGANCELSVADNTCVYATSCKPGYGNIQNNNLYNPSCSLNTYTVNFNLDGGANYANAPTSYTVETNTITLGTPTKTGYTFGGWYDNSSLSGTAVTKIAKGSTGNKEFWAKWTVASYPCEPGQYLPKNATACAICPADNYCVGASYTYSTTADQGISACTTGLVAPEGTTTAGGCGKILHVGEDIMYLTSEQQTTPALAVRIDGTVYYARTTRGEKAMNGTTTRSLRTRINGFEYSIHDNTAQEE